MEASPHERALLEQAASESLSFIASSHAQAASSHLKQLLRYLERHLFDQGLNANTWFRECKIRSHRVRALFREQLKLTPHAYLNEFRVAVAKNLLKDTHLEIWRVSELVGYSHLESFDRAFRRTTGVNPTAFRQKNQKDKNKALRRHDEALAPMRDWRKLLASAGTPEHLMELTDKNLKDYPSWRKFHEVEPEENYEFARANRHFERRNAEKVWKNLRNRIFSDQQLLIGLQISFQTTALFDVLREKSIEEGRMERQRGIQLAQLALASLDVCGSFLGEDLPNHLAQGWVCLANAFCVAVDLPQAEKAFERAEYELMCAGAHRDPLVEAELNVKKAKMRWYQRRYDPALALLDSAIPILRQNERHVELAQALIVRAGVHRHLGEPNTAITHLQEALELITPEDQPYLCLSAQSSLANSARLLGRYEQAKAALAEAGTLCRILNNEVGGCQIQWITGLLRQQEGDYERAEPLLISARSGLIKFVEQGYTAVVSLDLGILYLEQGRAMEALNVVGEALPLFEVLDLRGEALAALHLLRDSIDVGELSLQVLMNLRRYLAEQQEFPVP